ncbi:MAG TPA: hypothetical protein VKY19_09810 [Ktedonosporobacter sp.]|jgi:hypothetical protein|nr:hypothetical protein [Ktedonosporobacter sp.]
MEHQDQQPTERLETQIAQCSEKRRDKDCTTQQFYRSPQVLLIGKAQCLMAGAPFGGDYDGQGGYKP